MTLRFGDRDYREPQTTGKFFDARSRSASTTKGHKVSIDSAASHAKLECDLVMKGGVTSGVIYPRLVAKLAETYTFRSIGGTSAGAIAAAAAAAAQLGVAAGTNPSAFHKLERLPETLGASTPGGGSILLNLFQPQEALRGHFDVLKLTLNAPTKLQLVIKVYVAMVSKFPLGGILGALPGVILFFSTDFALAELLSIAVAAVGAVAGAAWAATVSFGRALPANQFGLCNGMPDGPTDAKAPQALTPWLDGYLNALAGKATSEPLTFGELWAGRLRAPGEAAPADDTTPANERVIHLAMVTTAVNLKRPYELPFASGDVYFYEDELARLFPERVVRWLVEHARPSDTADALSKRFNRQLYALPRPADFPVIVAVRLSLSFPILLSALPLYSVDRSLKANRDAPTRVTRVYFSDGGISSNFPVHFFDSPLTTRPTFGVNLRDFHPDHPDERVWLPEPLQNNRGLRNHLPPLSDAPGLGSVVGFLGAIVDTMQNWRDHMQLAMPGFRDRIVHVSHGDTEGGLNLDMPAATIETLANSGRAAAERLIEQFALRGGAASPNAWDNHVRIRARTTLCLLQQYLERIAGALDKKKDPTYEEILADRDPPSYPFPNYTTAEEAVRLVQDMQALARRLRELEVRFCDGAPRPPPDLRATPRV